MSSGLPLPGDTPPEDELSRRRRTEEKLKAAVSQLTATLDSTTDGIAVIGFDNRLLRYNQRFADLWRIPRESLDAGETSELLGMAIAQLAEPEAFFAPVKLLHADPLGETFDRLVFKDGRVYERFSRPLLSEGRATGRVWSFRDISARVRAESMQAALYKISQAAHSARDLDALFEAIHGIIAELLPAKNFYVALYDPATDLISFPYWVDEVDERPPPRKASERRGLTGLVLESGEPLLLSPGKMDELASRPGVGFMGSEGIDWLGIPLKTARATIGVLTVQNYIGDARYTERDKELLQFVSDQVAAAVESKLAERDRRRAEEWQQHYADVLAQIAAETPLPRVLDSLAAFAERQSPGMLCSIHLVSPDGMLLLHASAPSLPPDFNRATDGVPIGPHVGSCGACAHTGEVVIVEDVMQHPDWQDWRAQAQAAGLRACWSHPVRGADGRILGTFALYRREPSIPSSTDLELVRQSAGLAALAIERARHHEEQRLAKVVFEQSVQGLMVTDMAGTVLMVNESFEALTGYEAGEVVGRGPDFLDAGRDEAVAVRARQEALAQQGRWSGESVWRRKSGEHFPVAMSQAIVSDASGQASHTIWILSDVSEQKIQKARIEQLAFYDSLTGLPNRALFLDRLEHTLAQARRSGGHGAILFLDLDRFKEINDSQGHAIGDMALAEVARRLQQTAREGETLARIGGDEFVLIAENADIPTAVRIAARLGRVLSEPLELSGHAYSVGASIGIAFYPADGDRSEDLIRRTDIAMYQAKSGGGGYRLYQPEMGEKLEKRLMLAKRLQQALEAGKLQLFYQPQVALATGKLVGAEALLRWYDPDLGWISPSEFIPIAEERAMMVPLGDWVLREACRQVGEWQRAGLGLAGRIAINVSALQMEDPDIVGRLLEIVHEAGLRPDRFELELTESSMMSDPERAVEVLELLRAAGFGLSIDDFGTGYSSLSYLKRFAADHIKIDISFVRNMLTDANDYTIVTTIIAMADSLGLKTTAEGVEQAEQADALLALRCDSAQGHHFGHPEPAAAFARRWLEPPR